MSFRRVVMGSNEQGNAVVLADSRVEPTTATLLAGSAIYQMWGSDHLTLPVTGLSEGTAQHSFVPKPSGARFGFLSVAPRKSYVVPATEAEQQAAAKQLDERLPGLSETYKYPDQPGVHVTDSVDFIVVLSGRALMRVDDVEVRLEQGDCLVQNGTPHVWLNDGDEPFLIAYALCGAEKER